jgi:cobalamin biosynthesis protein CbiD
MPNAEKILNVEIPFPDGSRAAFKIHDAGCRMQKNTTYASVIKDAGDDPDVTNGAEIRAEVSLNAECGMRPALARALVVAGCRRNAE